MDVPDPTLAEYSRRWLHLARPRVRPGTYRAYESMVRVHLAPLADRDVRMLTAHDVRDWLTERLDERYALRFVRLLLYVISASLELALTDDLVTKNVARGAARGLLRRSREDDGVRKAMTREELVAFLIGVRAVRPKQADLFLLMARTGLRPGEALGLQWPDVDLERRQIRVVRTWSDRRGGPTKSGRARYVDLSQQVVRMMEQRWLETPRQTWIFESPLTRHPWDRSHIQRGMRAGLDAAGLPRCFHPHSLRHTFASLLIEAGWPIQWVQQQLGHRSIAMTVDIYGSAWRARNLPAVDSLDDVMRRPPLPAGHRHPVLDGDASGEARPQRTVRFRRLQQSRVRRLR